jgi:ABC-type nitrate/sulfonate/bicarbonate transport system substrate-binding protein
MGIKTRERLLNVLILIGALALLFVVGYPQYKESLPSELRIGVDKSYASVPFYIAKEDTTRKYFTLEKVTPVFVEINGDPLQGLKDGLYDVVAVPWYWLMIAPANNGDTVKAFGSIEIKSGKGLDAIVIPAKTKINRLSDLKSKRLGYKAGDEYLINLIVARMAEDKITKITPVPLQTDEIITAFADGKVDALFVIDPYRGYLVYNGSQVLMEGVISYYVVPSMPYAAIVMRKNFVKEENKLAAIRIKNAIEAALSYITRNPKVARDMVIKMNGWAQDDELSMAMRIPDYQRLAEINLKNVENLQTTLVRLGIGTCGIKPTEFLFERTDFVR